jgi:hypothetical protein
MAAGRRIWMGRAAFGALALLALAQAGCIALAAGAAAAGGAAVGYAYFTAPEARDYPAALPEVTAAARAALEDLKFPLVKEKTESAGVVLESQTVDKYKILIALDPLATPVPADGPMTHVTVRIGHFGDEEVSNRIHDQIARRIAPPIPAAATTGRLTPTPQPPPIPPVRQFETAQPPLADDVQPAKNETKRP